MRCASSRNSPANRLSLKVPERLMTQENQILDFIARLCLVLIFPFSTLDKIFNHQSAMAQAGHGLIALPDSMAALLLVLGGMLAIIGPVCCLARFYRSS